MLEPSGEPLIGPPEASRPKRNLVEFTRSAVANRRSGQLRPAEGRSADVVIRAVSSK